MSQPINYRSLFVLFCALLALTGASLAQPRKAEQKVSLIIHEVVKEDAKAVERGANRLVPVTVKLQLLAELADELISKRKILLNINLATKNTDGQSTTITEQLVMASNGLITLKLPMKKGVFAKDFVLLVKASEGRKLLTQTEKRGSF